MRIAFLLFFSFLTLESQAQTITLYKTFGGVQFERGDSLISTKQVHQILKENPEAYKQFKTARTNATVGSLLGFTGGLLIGIPLGSALVGGNPEWGLALGGVALVAVSIPFSRAYIRHADDAINTYNKKYTSIAKPKPELFWAGSTIGVRLRF